MSKLFIFGIGGTGSRVLKALTMLLAAGVKMKNTSEIVPIIIDPDHAAADLTRTVQLMRNYNQIREKLDYNTSRVSNFFSTEINMEILPSVTIPLKNTQDEKFKDYIGLDLMQDKDGHYTANHALVTMLFSEKNLNSNMDVGFKGNPNIGSVVLNQFANSDEFVNFAASFNQGDRIFIISSIFGGTGASGFPLLLKNLRTISKDIAGNENVRNAPIGAITVMPYFDVKPDNEKDNEKRSQIDSSTFVSKTKAALSYYDRNMRESNALYYIADTISKQYENSEGGTMQKNDAHFVELAAALSIVDFMDIPDHNLNTQNGIPNSTIYKEFGIKDDTEQIIFNNLESKTVNLIQKPLTQFVLFSKYLKEQMEASKGTTWAKDHQFDDNFFNSQFYASDLTAFRESYLDWLSEMASNKRSFTPFELSEKKKDVFSLIKGLKPRRLFKLSSNYALFDDILNSEQKNLIKDSGKESCFIELFYKSTDKLVDKKFRI